MHLYGDTITLFTDIFCFPFRCCKRPLNLFRSLKNNGAKNQQSCNFLQGVAMFPISSGFTEFRPHSQPSYIMQEDAFQVSHTFQISLFPLWAHHSIFTKPTFAFLVHSRMTKSR